MSRGLRFEQVAGAAAPGAWPPLCLSARALSCCPPHAAHRMASIDAASMASIKSDLLPCDYGCARYLCAPHSPVELVGALASVLLPLASCARGLLLLGHASCNRYGLQRSSIDQYNIAVELGRSLQLQRASIDRITVARTHSHSSRHGALSAALPGMCCSPKTTASANAADGLDVLGSV